MKRLLFLSVLLLSCVFLIPYSDRSRPVVYGTQEKWEYEYGHQSPAEKALTQFMNTYCFPNTYLSPSPYPFGRSFPDWYVGSYIETINDVPIFVINMAEGSEYMEDEIRQTISQAEAYTYTICYTPLSYGELRALYEKCVQETEHLPMKDQNGERIVAGLACEINVKTVKVEIKVYGDLKRVLGWKLYFKYLFHPYITLIEEPFVQPELASSAD